MMNDIAVYAATDGPALLNGQRPEKPLWMNVRSFVWTENTDGQKDGAWRLIVNTMLRQHIYIKPKLEVINNLGIVFSAFPSDDTSGMLRRIELVYIVLSHSNQEH